MRAGKAPSPLEVVILWSIQPMTERRETGAIHLAGPAVAGPWEYSLYRGSIDASAQENWYLRSELTPVPPHTTNSSPPTPPVSPVQPIPNPTPDYGPEVFLYAAILSMGAIYGRQLICSFPERVGEEE
ncbi:autotransporter outer membrane beta-barrel domain-containing protein [Ochrobactrum soli]|nr:autotransporter outer membrane beta-barrel domain-containing protein [[Ochrobactrum] soli]